MRFFSSATRFFALHWAFANRLNRKVTQISKDAISVLQKYKWPGNVRELANAIRRAVALSDGPQINIYDLPPHITEDNQNINDVQPIKKKTLVLADIEREHILAVLEVAKGNKSLAANMLGIHRDTLLRKLKRYGIK